MPTGWSRGDFKLDSTRNKYFFAHTLDIRKRVLSTKAIVDHARPYTLFSQRRFAEAVIQSSNSRLRIFELCGRTTQSEACMYGVAQHFAFGRCSVKFAPFGLYAYPFVHDGLAECIDDFIAQLQTLRVTSFEWNVRYDHSELGELLLSHRLPVSESTTHVLNLRSDYEVVFRGFSETTRNVIRRAQKKGLVVRRARDAAAVNAYYQIYLHLVEERGKKWSDVYSKALFDELLKLWEDVVFLVAEVGDNIVAGGWFFRDGDSLFYWQGAMDYAYSRYFPYYAFLDHGIRLACEEGMATFNMGGSGGSASLMQFKSFWGTKQMPCWRFTWVNPFWSKIRTFKDVCRFYT